MKNSTRAAEKWSAILDDWGRSGLSVARFCERRGVHAQSLYAWRRRLGDRAGGSREIGHRRPPFVEALLVASQDAVGAPHGAAASSSGVWIQTRRGLGGVRIGVERGFDPEVLRGVVAALEEAR